MKHRSQKRAFTFIMIILALALVLSGCGNNNNTPQPEAQPPQETGGSNQQQNEQPSGDGAPEDLLATPFEMSLMATYYTPQPPNTDNDVWGTLQDLTNTKLNVTWVPRSAYDDKVSISLASNDMPQAMLVFNYRASSLVTALKSGVFWEIGPYIEQFPNLSQMNKIQFNNTKIDGKTYGLYRPRSIAPHGITIRQDWLDNLGLSAPTTPEEMYNVLRAFTYDDPDGNKQHDTIGLGEYKDIEAYLLPHVSAWFGAPNKWSEENGKFKAEFMTPEYLDALKYIRKLYEEKLINQDFIVSEELQRSNLFAQGKTGVFLGNNTHAPVRNDELLKYDPDAVVELLPPMNGPQGQRVMAAQGFTGVYLFPKTSVKTEADLKRILAFFDRTLEDDIVNLTTWGIEGVHYKVTDGKAERLIESEQRALLIDSINELKIDDGSKRLIEIGGDPLADKATITTQKHQNIAVVNPALGLESETWTLNQAELNTIITDAKVKFITGRIDEAGWQEAIESWLKAGGEKVIQEFEENFQKSKQ